MKRIFRVIIVLTALLVVTAFGAKGFMLGMPGESYQGALPPLTEQQSAIKNQLATHIERLAGEIGERNIQNYHQLEAAAAYIESTFKQMGYLVTDQPYEVKGFNDRTVKNIIAEIPGTTRASEIVVVGAHYDTAEGSKGADDNASGVAGLLELARLLKSFAFERTIRFVAFVNEEPPYFYTNEMGSLVYAKAAKQKNENIVAMLSLESIGYYSDEPNSQHYPLVFGFFYPHVGNFVGFVSNLASRSLLLDAIGTFREHAKFPSEGAALPSWIRGVGWSDQWSFWKQGYPAIMISGTAIYRNPNYHLATDMPNTIDYDRTARVVAGIKEVVRDIAIPRWA